MNAAANRTVKVYGASLVQLWDECQRCFWRRYVLGEKRPRDFGETFDIADKAMKTCIASAGEWLDVGVGPQRLRLHSQSVWIESNPIPFDDVGIEIMIAGKYDAIVEDQDGAKILLDYKTTHKEEGSLPPYRRQLDAYRFAVEHPNEENAKLQPAMTIDEVGLLIYTPVHFAFRNRNSGLYGPTRWISYSRDDSAFLKFIGEVAKLLAGAEPRRERECDWCQYRGIEGRRTA